MFANQHFASLLPLRLPHWRLNRVTEILGHRPQPLQPRRMDDHFIRAYLRLLELLAASDDEDTLQAVNKQLPAVYEAHRYHYSADFRKRQEIEARLLTSESLDDIASKLAADPKAIEYYAALFFDVRDALDLRDWVSMMIRIRIRYDEESGCSRAEAARGYVTRMFAFFGGPLVLDALLIPFIGTEPPENTQEVRAWSEQALTQIVRTAGAAAAATIEVTGRNEMQFIRMAQRLARGRNIESGPGNDALIKGIQAAVAWFEEAAFK
jgi:hypothetical protein